MNSSTVETITVNGTDYVYDYFGPISFFSYENLRFRVGKTVQGICFVTEIGEIDFASLEKILHIGRAICAKHGY